MVCFNQFRQPRKKIDGAISIPLKLDKLTSSEEIVEIILSRELPETWGDIDLDQICYQLSTTLRADQFNLKTSNDIQAFVTEAINKKNIQLCVYQRKYKKTKTGSSIADAIILDKEPEVYIIEIIV